MERSTGDAVTQDWLEKNALWIIMDPWYPHPWPHDVADDPDINSKADRLVKQILAETSKVKHIVTSCPDRFPIHSALGGLTNIPNETPGVRGYFRVNAYMVRHDLKHVVYLGFHLGRCILNKDTGALMMRNLGYTTWLKQDLTECLITDNYQAMLDRSREVMNII